MVWCKNRYLLIVDLSCQNSNWQIFIAFSATKDSVQNHRIVQKIWPNNWSNTRFWGIRICVMTIRLSKMPAKFYLEEGRGLVKALLIYSLALQRFVETIDILRRYSKSGADSTCLLFPCLVENARNCGTKEVPDLHDHRARYYGGSQKAGKEN